MHGSLTLLQVGLQVLSLFCRQGSSREGKHARPFGDRGRLL